MGRRHLSFQEAKQRIVSGLAVQNWLGSLVRDGDRLIKWMRVRQDAPDEFEVTISTAYDQGDFARIGISSFQPYYPDEPFGLKITFEDLERALDFAILDLKADQDRFVNDGVIELEYKDFLLLHGIWPRIE